MLGMRTAWEKLYSYLLWPKDRRGETYLGISTFRYMANGKGNMVDKMF